MIAVVNIAWAIIAMIAIASQCSHPRPWAIISENCFNQVRCLWIFIFFYYVLCIASTPAWILISTQNPFWYVIGTFDILVNLAIIALPIYVLYDIQMSWSRKFAIMGAFGVRFL